MKEEPPTGGRRRRATRPGVRLADRAARALITAGGVGTIVVVLGVCAFLIWVAFPLSLPASFSGGGEAPPPRSGAPPLHWAVDEYGTLAWAAFADGTLDVVRLDTGALLFRKSLFGGERPTAASFSPAGEHASFGFADGTVRLLRIGFSPRFLPVDQVPEEFRALPVGSAVPWRDGSATEGMILRLSGDRFRAQRLLVETVETVRLDPPAPVRLLDHAVRGEEPFLCALCADGTLRTQTVRFRRNFLTGETVREPRGAVLPHASDPSRDGPFRLLLSGLADTAILLWEDGHAVRFDTRDFERPQVAETLSLVGSGEGTRLTAATFLIGRTSLAVGDSSGGVSIWFRVKPEGAFASDGARLVRSHSLRAGEPAPVTALAASHRSRILAAGFADGRVRLFQVTSQKSLGELDPAAGGGPVHAVALFPKDDGMAALTSGGISRWNMDPRHPEATFASVFAPVWYEGHERPEHVWQSSSGTDDFEPKFGLMPLVFGTVKATFYSMLFALPLALPAALYTNAFLSARTAARVKPVIELMAGLPSVVLGFLAALVFAPWVERALPSVLASLATVPAALLSGAFAWQILPASVASRLARARLPAAALFLAAGAVAAFRAGPAVERWLFAGDLRLWLDGRVGSGAPGWMLLSFPASAVAVAAVCGRLLRPALAARLSGAGRTQAALADGILFACAAAATVALAWGVSTGLAAMGFDPRGTFVDTYVQRNAFVVGIVMGFAVIPILYTIAEDALSAVPEHLRAASLALGATRWQTATRVLLPTAMSGLFSAVMVGLGRAVGETMIVLMAAGNTPVLEWNVFNGFRTLSANIAVELPEAPRDGTHYRMLFLAALSLFAMTFVVNTAAETVRLRFRKKACAL